MTEHHIILLLGVYLVGGGSTLLLNPGRVTTIVDSMDKVPFATYVTGAAMGVAGAAILLTYHDVSTFARGLATLVGGGILLEGWLMMAMPKTLMSMAKPFYRGDRLTRGIGLVVILLGILTIWYGLSA
ncbi:hypothetical protein [Henriciella marina]|uniref:DUF2065 domain-containing protein n=1 Tax=Henriciella marina TaxID=453851 RepID=A0ABT4LQM3_9PROT|nr:hypothetical protein [Henriciella marina]MCZ4296664.1 hypothetical protein [Henriciella marina]